MRPSAVFSIASVAIACSYVSADTVDLRFVGFGSGKAIQYEQAGQVVTTFAGQRMYEVSGGTGSLGGLSGTVATFGSSVMGNSIPLRNVEYAATPVDQMWGREGIGEIGQIRSSAIGDIYSFAAGRQLELNADFAAAFQVAIWEVIADYDLDGGAASLDASAGSATFLMGDGSGLSAGIVSHLAEMFGAIGSSNSSGLFGLSGPGGGGEFLVVPLPTSGAMGGLALMLLASRRRRGGLA